MMYTVTLLSLLPLLAVVATHQQYNSGMKQGKLQQDGMSCTPHDSNKAVKVGKAIYILTNTAENAVIALPIGADGKLFAGKMAKTGGAGSAAVNAEGEPEGPDALASQSAVTVVGNNLFAVNPGSNTLTMMAISNQDPTALTWVGKPIKVPGEFPNTVAASAKNKVVCVGTTGAVAGISCTSFSDKGMSQMDSLRPFDLGQTTPPLGPLNTVSHTFFSADETVLFTTVKGDPTVNKTGFLSTFPVQVEQGGPNTVSAKGAQSSPNGTAVLFGSAIIAKDPSFIFATDASFGAAVLEVDSTGQATVKGAGKIQGQKATCWATISGSTNSAYVTDVAVNRVVEMSLDDASIIKELDLSANGDPGLIDLYAAGDFVYALSPGNGTTNAAITVLDVSGGKGSMKQIQHFDLGRMGAGRSSQGMAVVL